MSRLLSAETSAVSTSRRSLCTLIIILGFVAGHLSTGFAAGRRNSGSIPRGRLSVDAHTVPININNMTLWASDNGQLERNPNTGVGGLVYPAGTVTATYGGGLVITGQVHDGRNPLLRFGGQVLESGTIPGAIKSPGVRESTWLPDVHMFRIRRDWKTADLLNDAAQILGISVYDVTPYDIADLRAQYASDWMTWPAQKGAPYYERNGIPGYQPDTSGTNPNADEPGLGGADMVTWCVANDLNTANSNRFGGTIPFGMEWQVTCWAYSGRPELNDVIFQRYRLIYKGSGASTPASYIESMYLGKWVDPDLGDNTDDFAGYDAARQLGYVYNSNDIDAEYTKIKMVPPAIGWALLGGPMVPLTGATAHFNLQPRRNYANLPANSFTALENDFFEDSVGNVPSREWNNLLQGYRPRPSVGTPQCFRNPFSGNCTKFTLDGDPVTRTGWVDGWSDKAGDRRFMIAAGPIRMNRGDTTEVMIAVGGGQGKDRLDGITVLRSHIDAARDLYATNFSAPATPPAPPLKIVALDKTLIFDWESDTTQTKLVEQYSSQGYKFYNYAIRQFDDSLATAQSVLLPPFDLSGPRSLYVTHDYIRNKDLANGRRYYFAVSAIMYNPDSSAGDHYIESPLHIVLTVPHLPDPGVVYPYAIGDTVHDIQNVVGRNDAPVRITFFDPTKSSAAPYKILFHRPTVFVKATWDLIDSGTGDTLLSHIAIESPALRVFTRGLSAYVGTPHFGLKDISLTRYKGNPVHELAFNYPDVAKDIMLLGEGTSQLDTITGATSSDLDIEWRFTGDSSWALFFNPTSSVFSKWVRVPYTVWQIAKNDTDARQVYSVVKSAGLDTVWRPRVLLDRSYNGKTLKVFYPVSIYADSQRVGIAQKYYGNVYYDDIPFRAESTTIRGILWADAGRSKSSSKMSIDRIYLADLDEDGVAAPQGTIIRFTKYKDIFDGDEKLFYSKGVEMANAAATQEALNAINVFPNPYYGVNNAERNRLQKFVTFSHLPAEATIRIFNTAGVLVRTVTKSGGNQFTEWDLNNENGLPVASGIYLAHLELRDGSGADLGSKILKLMIVQEEHFFQTR